jgi:hypothetical protein
MINTLSLVRDLINDNPIKGDTYITYNGNGIKTFALYDDNVAEISIKVKKNGTNWASSGSWSYDEDINSLIIFGTLNPNDNLLVTYTYNKYSTTELEGNIKNALYYISVAQYKDFVVCSGNVILDGVTAPTVAEYRLIALITKIIIDPDITGYRTSEVTINFNKSDTKEVKIEKSIMGFRSFNGIIGFLPLDTSIAPSEE